MTTSYSKIVVLAILVGSTSLTVAQNKQTVRGSRRQLLLKRFDKDADGTLSATERAAALAELANRRANSGDSAAQEQMTWKVDGLDREALVFLPTKRTAAGTPVVFGFHGHGGTARNAARMFGFPEAVARGPGRLHARHTDARSTDRSERQTERLATRCRRAGRPRSQVL